MLKCSNSKHFRLGGGVKSSHSKCFCDFVIGHSERSEESPDLTYLISELKVIGFNKSIPLFTSPLIRGEHSNPSLSREGLGMGFVQKNGAVNLINRSRISDSLRSHAYRLSHPHFVAVLRFVKFGMTSYVYSDHPFCHSERSEESQELSNFTCHPELLTCHCEKISDLDRTLALVGEGRVRYEQPLTPNVINNPVIAKNRLRFCGNLIKSTANDPEPMGLLRRFAPHNDELNNSHPNLFQDLSI